MGSTFTWYRRPGESEYSWSDPSSNNNPMSATSFHEILLTQLALLVNNSQLIDNTHWETFILTILPILLIPGIPTPPSSPATSTWTTAPVSWFLLTTGAMNITLVSTYNLVFKPLPRHQYSNFAFVTVTLHYTNVI